MPAALLDHSRTAVWDDTYNAFFREPWKLTVVLTALFLMLLLPSFALQFLLAPMGPEGVPVADAKTSLVSTVLGLPLDVYQQAATATFTLGAARRGSASYADLLVPRASLVAVLQFQLLTFFPLGIAESLCMFVSEGRPEFAEAAGVVNMLLVAAWIAVHTFGLYLFPMYLVDGPRPLPQAWSLFAREWRAAPLVPFASTVVGGVPVVLSALPCGLLLPFGLAFGTLCGAMTYLELRDQRPADLKPSGA